MNEPSPSELARGFDEIRPWLGDFQPLQRLEVAALDEDYEGLREQSRLFWTDRTGGDQLLSQRLATQSRPQLLRQLRGALAPAIGLAGGDEVVSVILAIRNAAICWP